MKDPKRILIQQTPNVQTARQLRFTDVKEIVKMKTTIKAYVKEAMKVEESGKLVEMKKTADFGMPEEFRKELANNTTLKKAFTSLTPGRQRGYLLYFSNAKQSKTREARIEKYRMKILRGKGMED